jgi:AraC-like DNA-binding protein
MIDLPKSNIYQSVDPLSDLLGLLRARCLVTASLQAGGDWAMRFPAYEVGTLKFTAVLQGNCALRTEGDVAYSTSLREGDCVLLNGPPGYVVASDLALTPVDAQVAYAHVSDGRVRVGGVDAKCTTHLIGGMVRFDDGGADLLLDSLPPVLVVQGSSSEAGAVLWLLRQLARESAQPQVGSASTTEHLAHLLFVQALRAHLATQQAAEPHARGWLAAVAEPRLGKALSLIHAHPSQPWTLDALAVAANMSRSTFSARFKASVGRAPMDYLLHWRMQRAARALRTGMLTIASIAFENGYSSESAFSHAFKRVTGQAPAKFRRQAAPGREGPSVAVVS